ncbi:MAG TPA: OmpA family protein [Terriglobales bacterium]|jgi:OmpA-OmpF porin, OOP family|nr:OmpA family protein [Terriglobales bacterium]
MPAETNNRSDAAGSLASSSAPSAATNKIVKVAIIAAALIVLSLVMAMGSCMYIAFKAKRKAKEIVAQRQRKSPPTATNRSTTTPSSEPHSAVGDSISAPFDNASPNSAAATSANKVPANLGDPAVPIASTGDPAHDWPLHYERTEGGPEADLVVRTGDINNLGFGWPKIYDPFSGKSTPAHPFPWPPKAGAPAGTDQILLGSAVTPSDFNEHPFAGDGYTSTILRPCQGSPTSSPCKNREDAQPQPIVLSVGALPATVNAVLIQIFVDDFQATSFHSHFQASLNGTRIPSIEQVLNALEQTGPIGKLISVNLLPEYFPLLRSGTVKLLIDDPVTHAQDGYAVDFVRILVNPHKFQYMVSVAVTVKDWDKNTPISSATVTAALQTASTDANGNCELNGVPAGLVVATAAAPGYDANSATADIVAGQSGHAEIQLHRHEEGTSALEKAIAQTGSAAIYGIHFDSDSAKLRPDSTPALEAVLGLINNHSGSRWVIAGHTDDQGNREHNQTLSQSRAASVIAWLKAKGVDVNRLVPQGFGASRPVADNATANGRALNRRVEIATAQK